MRSGRAIAITVSMGLLLPFAAAAQPTPAGAEFQVNAYTTDEQSRAQACHDSAGNFFVVYVSGDGRDGDADGVFAGRFDSAGQPQGTEFQVNSYTPEDQYAPHLCCDPAGNFVVTWTSYEQDGYGAGIFGQRFSSAGQPSGTEFQVNTYTEDYQETSHVCCDAMGNFVVAWESFNQDGDADGTFSQLYDSNGQPRGQEFQVASYTLADQGDPSDICCDARGNFVVAWKDGEQDGDGSGVAVRRFNSSGQPLSSDSIVNSYTTGNQTASAINCDAAGNFNVVWIDLDRDGDRSGVFARSFTSSGQPLHDDIQVNSYTIEDQARADVCCDGAGNFTVTWTTDDQDGDNQAIFARTFGRTGQALTPEFLVNSYTVSFQEDSAISCNAANFVVVWDSGGQDGSNAGVFAQLFQTLGAPSAVPVAGAAGLALLVTALAGGGVALLSRRRR